MGATSGILRGIGSGAAAKDHGPLNDRLIWKGGPVEAYCVKGKHKVEMKDPQKVTMKNGKPAWKGTCPVDGTTVFRIGA